MGNPLALDDYLPERKEKRLLQVHIESDLLDQVLAKMKEKHITRNQLLHALFRAWLDSEK